MATFGYTEIGETENYVPSSSNIMTCRFTLAEAGIVSKITAYICSYEAGKVAKALIYDDDGGIPKNLVAVSDEVTNPAGFGWVDFPINVELSAGVYHLAIFKGSSWCGYRYDDGESGQICYEYPIVTYPNPPDQFSYNATYTWNRKVSIYATYMPSVPKPKAPTHTLTVDSTPIQGVPFTIERVS